MIDVILFIVFTLFLTACNFRLLSLAKADNFYDPVYKISDNKFITLLVGIVILIFTFLIFFRDFSYPNTHKIILWILLFPIQFYIRFKNYFYTKEGWHLVKFTVFTIVQTMLIYKHF